MKRVRSGVTSIVVRPIGQDPEELRSLNQGLNIWDAYATIHLLMPDGSMKVGGEAVAAVLRNLPSTKWFTWTFAISCGRPSPWVRPISWMVKRTASLLGERHQPVLSPHFAPMRARGSPRRAQNH
jgi:hypothetical protein